MHIEKEFFECLRIDPYDRYLNCKSNKEGECLSMACQICDESEEVFCYPNITDSTLLKLIVLFTSVTKIPINIPYTLCTTEELKEEIMQNYIHIFKNPILKDSKKEYLRMRVWQIFDLFHVNGDEDGK